MKNSNDNQSPANSEILIYKTDDGRVRIDVRIENDTAWLTQAGMAELFQTTTQNITTHLKAIYKCQELSVEATCKEYLQVQKEGQREVSRTLKYYNLDAILAVGYRVRSPRGNQFRAWASAQLKEFIVKGFVLDDERLKLKNSYFEDLLARIRDIRSSEKVFYRKIQDIYATSIDYDSDTERTQAFFATVQNKMHWAVAGKTAAEIIYERADSAKPNMGLTSWSGKDVKKSDVTIAKNYLAVEELDILNRLVNQYLEYAELQALSRKPMYMKDWAKKLDDFLKFNDQKILDSAGKVSAQMAEENARKTFEQYQKIQLSKDTAPFHPDFEKTIKALDLHNSLKKGKK